MLAVCSINLALCFETLNAVVLFGRNNIFNAAQTYFGMIIMIEFPNLYFASLIEPKVKEIL